MAAEIRLGTFSSTRADLLANEIKISLKLIRLVFLADPKKDRLRDGENMLIGYMRVSKSDGSQNLDLQCDALLNAGVEATHIYEHQASGKDDERPGFNAACKALRSGDVLVTYKLDRLGRSLKHLVNTDTHLPIGVLA